MYFGKTIAVVVPAYNEQDCIGDTILNMPEIVDKIYVVDDASTDHTRDVIDSLDHNERMICIAHSENRGVGAAIASGYKAAINDNIDIMVVMAGDNQMDPSYMHHIVTPVATGEADYSKGNRVTSKEHSRGMSVWRQLGNLLLKHLTRIAAGNYTLQDPQDGYTEIATEHVMPVCCLVDYSVHGVIHEIHAGMYHYGT